MPTPPVMCTRPALERSRGALARLRWLALSVLALLAVLPQRGASETLFFVPVYEWVLVWKDWRNPNYKMGSLWRPKMIAQYNQTDFPGEMNRRIDGYDVRGFVSANFEVVFLGDVFMPGHGTGQNPPLWHLLTRLASHLHVRAYSQAHMRVLAGCEHACDVTGRVCASHTLPHMRVVISRPRDRACVCIASQSRPTLWARQSSWTWNETSAH
jgi:hypothetical protein